MGTCRSISLSDAALRTGRPVGWVCPVDERPVGAGVSHARWGGRGFFVPVFVLPSMEALCAEAPPSATFWGWEAAPISSCESRGGRGHSVSACSLGSGLRWAPEKRPHIMPREETEALTSCATGKAPCQD